MKKSFAPIPGLEDELNEEEYETEEVSVKIVELSTADLAANQNWIGQNRPQYDTDPQSNDQDDKPLATSATADEIPGMGLTVKPQVVKATDSDSAKENKNAKSIADKDFKSKRDLLRTIQKGEMRTLKSSKAFKTKQKLDRVKDRKKGKIEREKRMKMQNKEAKKKGGRVNAKKIKRSKNKSRK